MEMGGEKCLDNHQGFCYAMGIDKQLEGVTNMPQPLLFHLLSSWRCFQSVVSAVNRNEANDSAHLPAYP